MASALGLRPGQVATRLVQGRLSAVPTANRKLWVELGNTAANLVQLMELLDGAADDGSPEAAAWKERVAELRDQVGALRADVLGAQAEEGR
jgi:hypothetical protein